MDESRLFCQSVSVSLASDIRQFCAAHKLGLNTDLGQHFLVDEAVLDAIIDAAHLTEQDTVVEIGPGIGILTKELLARSKRVQVVELDRRMIPLLAIYTSPDGNVHPKLVVEEGNALKAVFPNEPYKIVANIPYHITSPLLRHAFLESPRPPTSLTLLIQREVAERICDPENASLLSIVVGMYGSPRIIRHVPKAAFLPPPEVESSVLQVDCFDTPKTDEQTMESALRLAKIAFAGKRKTLNNTLGRHEEGDYALRQTGIDASRRPQTLSIDEWCALGTAALRHKGSA